MNLYNVDMGWQGYEAYSGAVIAAPDEVTATTIMLDLQENYKGKEITCICIGVAADSVQNGIVRSSFNAG